MPNRGPLSEETKKKISEALKKGTSSVNVKSTIKSSGSPEMEKLRNRFDGEQKEIDDARSQIEKIKNSLSSKTSGKKSKAQKTKDKAQKDEARKQIKELKDRIKAAIKKQKAFKKQAQKLKRLKKAQDAIAKANEGIKKANALEGKIKALAAKRQTEIDKRAATPSKKKKGDMGNNVQSKSEKISEQRKNASERLQSALDRVAKVKQAHEERIKKANDIIKSKGEVEESDPFSFNDVSHSDCVLLYERRPIVKWRTLSLLEQRVNFEYLNQEFNDLEGELETDLQRYMDVEIEKNVDRIHKKIKSGDLAFIGVFSVMGVKELAKILVNYSKQAFEVGKKSASEEMDVQRYPTSQKMNIILGFEANETARNIVNQINALIKQRAKEEIIKKDIEIKKFDEVSVGSFINMEDVKKIAERLRRELVGSYIGEKINQGRRFVFEKNIQKLLGYQRTEYLDFRICNICRSLNGKNVKTDDPFAKLDKVHTYCRGFWMPILVSDKIDDSFGLPKKITKAFDLIGNGYPVMNAFRQLKKIV